MKNLKVLTAVLFWIGAQSAFAHGEDKPGPNGGFIRMPAAYHTEVVPKKGALAIYLLDIKFQNPTVEKSSVEATLSGDKGDTTLACLTKTDHFECEIPKGASLKKGELKIKSTRMGEASPAPAVYKLPFKHTGHAGGH